MNASKACYWASGLLAAAAFAGSVAACNEARDTARTEPGRLTQPAAPTQEEPSSEHELPFSEPEIFGKGSWKGERFDAAMALHRERPADVKNVNIYCPRDIVTIASVTERMESEGYRSADVAHFLAYIMSDPPQVPKNQVIYASGEVWKDPDTDREMTLSATAIQYAKSHSWLVHAGYNPQYDGAKLSRNECLLGMRSAGAPSP